MIKEATVVLSGQLFQLYIYIYICRVYLRVYPQGKSKKMYCGAIYIYIYAGYTLRVYPVHRVQRRTVVKRWSSCHGLRPQSCGEQGFWKTRGRLFYGQGIPRVYPDAAPRPHFGEMVHPRLTVYLMSPRVDCIFHVTQG